jgi:hypothetical protein
MTVGIFSDLSFGGAYGDRLLRFSGFELDYQRAELRGRNGEPIRRRPKSFTMLHALANNPGKVPLAQHSRLAAGVYHPLAARLNELASGPRRVTCRS